MEMLSAAVERGADLSMIEKLMALEERWSRNRARSAFDAAISDAKAEIPIIGLNRTGHNGKRYADFAAFAAAVDPILSKHGLSYRFRATQTDSLITVACILSHRDGHSEENTLSGPADTTGSKNAIQSIGSTLTYLQRYSLKQALGLAAGEDDDGKASGLVTISDDQAAALRELAEQAEADLASFCQFMGVESIPAIAAKDYAKADQALRAKLKAKAKAAGK